MRPTTFRAPDDSYSADTCAPLEAAVARGELRMEALARGAYPGTRLAPRALPGVRTAGWWDAPRAQSWGLDWHRNEGIELTWLESGHAAVRDRRGRDRAAARRPHDHAAVAAPPRRRPARHARPPALADPRRRRAPARPAVALAGLAARTAGELTRLTELLRHNEHPVWPGDAAVADAFRHLGAAVEASSTRWVGLRVCELVLAVAELLERREPPLDASLSSTERAVALFLSRRWPSGWASRGRLTLWLPSAG